MATEIWSRDDQRKLESLLKKREETVGRQSKALLDLLMSKVKFASGCVQAVNIGDLRDALIEDAGPFRDALKPFDHMGRPEAVEEKSGG